MGQYPRFADDTTLQYFNCGASPNLNITGALSIDCWIKFKNVGVLANTRRLIFDRSTGGVGGYNFAINTFITPGIPTLSLTKTAIISNDSTVAIQENALTHVAYVWTGVNNSRFYRDGSLIQTIVEANAILGAPAAIAYVNALSVTYKYPAFIYNLNIYNRALSTTEILYNKEHPNNPIRNGLQLALNQESFIGGVWKDKSPNAYDGTPVGSPLLIPSNNIAGRNGAL